MAFDTRGDVNLVPVFKNIALENKAKTAIEGRPIFEDVEHVEIHAPGSKNFHVHPATDFSHWEENPLTGDQTKVSYAERFSRQYQQFKARQQQTKIGTPLDHAPFLTEARRAELRALNVYTVEQLAGIEGQELKNLGLGGRDLKNRATEWMAEQKVGAPNLRMQDELDAERARNQILAEELTMLKQQRASSAEGQFEEMTDQQISDYIKDRTGYAPQGDLPRKSLLLMAGNLPRPARTA